MKPSPTVLLILAAMLWACAPTRVAAPPDAAAAPAEAVYDGQELLDLSLQKWLWMADRDGDALAALFHPDARFVHMGGTWGTARELDVIESGGIWYKQADVHEAVVETFGNTAVVWNRITLLAEVGGTEVTNPFAVTEVYQRHGESWALLALTFSSVRDGHTIEPEPICEHP
ncbi:nuclear transport factor 2 family protein [Rubrivirga sp.]|uniref:nuclear transport factor 2 family protein n=1 Tax=Rubrivirga sp. TaxID=1885344 RepID=UPI003B525FA3